MLTRCLSGTAIHSIGTGQLVRRQVFPIWGRLLRSPLEEEAGGVAIHRDMFVVGNSIRGREKN